MALVKKETLYAAAQMDEVERCIVQMERNGFALDVPFCDSAAASAKEEEAVCLIELDKWCERIGVDKPNWASPKQLVELLHDKLSLPPSPVWKKGRVKVAQGDRKLDEVAIAWIRDKSSPLLGQGLDELIRLRRLRGSIKYLSKLPTFVAPDGLVHPVSGPSSDFDDRAGTITWRLASKNPEVMQIPTDPKKDWFGIRKAFVATPGHTLLCADETALEAVIFAHVLIKLFDDHVLADLLVPGTDLHAVNARRVFGEYLHWERHGHRVDFFPPEAFKSDSYPDLQALRQDIKAIWYGLMYGKSAYGFATSLRNADGSPIGLDAAQAIVTALYAVVPAIPRYQSFILEYIQRYDGIPGLGGAWCDLSDFTHGDKWSLARAHRIAQNYPMQEGGARIIGAAMVGIMADPILKAQGLLVERQVHDELDFRIPLLSDIGLAKERIRYHMTSYPLTALLQVKIGQGDSWHSAKS